MSNRGAQFENLTLAQGVFHCALDDTIDVLEEINQKAQTLNSIFDVGVLALLKEFHDHYGATFSLYLFYEKTDGFNLSQMTDKFAQEWRRNSHWLRLSFHARTRKPEVVDYYLYDHADYQTAKEDFEIIKHEILRFAGPQSWDNYPRTHFWSGTKQAVQAWRDCGVSGLFYSYPGYPAMYFDEPTLKQLWRKDFHYDCDIDMLFITTNVKLPCMTIAKVEQNLTRLTNRKIIEIFADDYNIIELKERMETALRWATENGFKPVFYDDIFDDILGQKHKP